MFKCHKCGYEDLTDKEKTSCPICGANIVMPKFALTLFLSLVLFIIFSIVSCFNSKLSFIPTISIITAIIALPFAIMEAIDNNSKVQDGFKAPDYPSEVQKGSARIPNFEEYGYVGGLNNDVGIKKVMIEVYKDGLNIYHQKLQDIITVDYKNIVGIELNSDIDIKQSNAKGILTAAVLGAAGGIGAALLGAAFGGVSAKDVYFLELQIKENDVTYSIFLTDKKERLLTLAYSIENQVNEK